LLKNKNDVIGIIRSKVQHSVDMDSWGLQHHPVHDWPSFTRYGFRVWTLMLGVLQDTLSMFLQWVGR
jgi:hypothetical protein